MLANLDNEVFFKKVFTNVEVFTAFVKDVLNIDIDIDKVETEKVLSLPTTAIKFKMDLFAEDKKNRTVVEIQKIDYDYTYDRFAHYFMGNIIDLQRSSKTYAYAKDVYVIVVVTSAYKISDINGQPIKEDVMITDINPRNLKGELIEMNNHKMFILNTSYDNQGTPQDIVDWLDLIRESMVNPENPHINTKKTAIAKAVELAEHEKLDPEELADAKIQEMRKIALVLIQKQTREDTTIEVTKEVTIEVTKEVTKEVTREVTREVTKEITDKGIIKAFNRGRLTIEEIAEDFEVTVEYVQQILDL